MAPVESLEYQWHVLAHPSTEDERADGHASRVFPFRINAWDLAGRCRETGIGVRGGPPAIGCPVFALPIDRMCWRRAVHAFPPDIAIVGQCGVGNNAVAGDAQHRIGVGRHVGARCHAENTRFGIDRAQAAIWTFLNPSDIVANRGDFPAFETFGWNQHCQVSLAAGAGHGAAEVGFLTLRRFNSHD